MEYQTLYNLLNKNIITVATTNYSDGTNKSPFGFIKYTVLDKSSKNKLIDITFFETKSPVKALVTYHVLKKELQINQPEMVSEIKETIIKRIKHQIITKEIPYNPNPDFIDILNKHGDTISTLANQDMKNIIDTVNRYDLKNQDIKNIINSIKRHNLRNKR